MHKMYKWLYGAFVFPNGKVWGYENVIKDGALDEYNNIGVAYTIYIMRKCIFIYFIVKKWIYKFISYN